MSDTNPFSVTVDGVSIVGSGTPSRPFRVSTWYKSLSLDNGEAIPVLEGSPIVVLGGLGRLAINNSYVRSFVVGIVIVGNEPTLSLSIASDGYVKLTSDQWDLVTGEIGGLSIDAEYFLDSSLGKIITAPPITSGSFVVNIGRAISKTTLVLQQSQPILL